jgi:hypothetical protein
MISWFQPTYFATSHGANASNSPVRIVIKAGIKYPAAVAAQERREWGIKAPYFAAGVLPVLLWQIPSWRRSLEIQGHAVEIAVASQYYGADIDKYEISEAVAMRGYPQFKGWDLPDILALLRAERSNAAKWVRGKRKLIERYRAALD